MPGREPDRAEAHVFLCLLASRVDWQMGQKPATLLYAEKDRGGHRNPQGIVRPFLPRPTQKKAQTYRIEEGLLVLGFPSLSFRPGRPGNPDKKRHANRTGPLPVFDAGPANGSEAITIFPVGGRPESRAAIRTCRSEIRQNAGSSPLFLDFYFWNFRLRGSKLLTGQSVNCPDIWDGGR